MLRTSLWASLLLAACVGASSVAPAEHNTLTADEEAAGWSLLFDGETYEGWTGMKGSELPSDHWMIEDGTLATVPGRGRDLVTTRPYESFELKFDVKILEDGNNGVKYFVQQEWNLNPDRPGLGAVGHEYQILDDAILDRKPGWEKASMGSFYLIHAPAADKNQSPFGEWNRCRIVVEGKHVEHWLNGEKILEYELGTDELLAQVQRTKFRDVPGFGAKNSGYIVLTHHNEPAWFRNIKIRELD